MANTALGIFSVVMWVQTEFEVTNFHVKSCQFEQSIKCEITKGSL